LTGVTPLGAVSHRFNLILLLLLLLTVIIIIIIIVVIEYLARGII